jgi:antitoxin ParD1/3/4
MTTMNVSLPDPMKEWVEAQVQTGRYSNASDYVRDLIRRDQEREQAKGELQRLITAGVESGPAQPFDVPAFLAGMRKRHGTGRG